MSNRQPLSIEEITKTGEKFYNEELKASMEKTYAGQYVVIDVEQKKYTIAADRLMALENAKKEFGDKLFYIVQIGDIQHPVLNFFAKKYAWNF